jgi:hypothetical protein
MKPGSSTNKRQSRSIEQKKLSMTLNANTIIDRNNFIQNTPMICSKVRGSFITTFLS